MRQISTPSSWSSAKRNAAVVEANIRCHAVGCERQATRYSNLCGLCEKQWLEDHKPVFGKPTPDQHKSAEEVIRLLACALVIDAMITPILPQPVRRDYMLALLGQRFIGR